MDKSNSQYMHQRNVKLCSINQSLMLAITDEGILACQDIYCTFVHNGAIILAYKVPISGHCQIYVHNDGQK